MRLPFIKIPIIHSSFHHLISDIKFLNIWNLVGNINVLTDDLFRCRVSAVVWCVFRS